LDGREDAFGSERKEERAETIASEDELENEQEELILVRERRKRCAAAAKECAAAENAAAKHTLDVLTRVFIIIESRRRNRIEKERNEYLVHT
tara:strand:+ start:155 stop:430 length:276 start_codon:yes stop_codon:yes gene_type:complete